MSKITHITLAISDRNPFPGLRPFRDDEDHLFFGRESQVNTMIDKLAATRFLTVVGTSGSGKSSLVNCGLRPALYRGLMSRAGTSWRIAQFRPGSDPVRAMARALAAKGVLFSGFEPEGLSLAEMIEATLRMSKLGLVDMYEQAQPGERVNLLVVVDQFEELFRFRRLGSSSPGNEQDRSQEAIAFVNLLLEARAQTDFPIYIVLTMRSDFLGDCAQLPGLPEAINEGQYLVPRMTREELRSAIIGPVGVGGAEISPVLLTRLVNDVGDNPDQLSILQHALNRTWARWEHEGKGEGPLALPHYEAIGTMAQALDQHAEKAFSELGEGRPQTICEKIFKALTDKGTDMRGIRRPTSLAMLCDLSGANQEEVTQVINVFRKPSRSFLMPPLPESLEPSTIIDISHESLMRVWNRLKTWVEEEAESAAQYRRLAQSATLYAKGAAGLMVNPELSLTLNWRDKNQPNAAWAGRYHPGFEQAMAYLQESHKVQETEDLAAKERFRSKRRRVQKIAVVAGLVILLATAVISSVTAHFTTLSSVAQQANSAAAQAAEAAKLEASARLVERQARQAAEKVARIAQERAEATTQAVKAQAEALTAKGAQDGLEFQQLNARDEKERLSLDAKIKAASVKAQRLALKAAKAWSEAAAISVGGSIVEEDSISKTDLFDTSQGIQVTESSGTSMNAGSRLGMFGGSRGTGDGAVTCFADGKPAGTRHYVQWKTAGEVDLQSIGLFARHDADIDGFKFRRAFSSFKLYGWKDAEWVLLVDYSPSLPYGAGREGNVLGVCLPVTYPNNKPFKAQDFKAEFIQAVDILGQISAPRIVALDGYSQPQCPKIP